MVGKKLDQWKAHVEVDPCAICLERGMVPMKNSSRFANHGISVPISNSSRHCDGKDEPARTPCGHVFGALCLSMGPFSPSFIRF